MRILVDNQQIQLLARAMEKAPETVRKHLRAAVTEASQLLEKAVKENTEVGLTGATRQSIESEERFDAHEIMGAVGSAEPHIEALETGTKPHHPPVKPLIDWAKQKFGLSAGAAESAGWAIAKKIAKKGTEGQFMFKRAFDDHGGAIQRIFSTSADAAIQEVLR